jgi:hypothetical protein
VSIFFSFAKLTNSVKAESVIFADHWVSNKGHTQYLSQSRYSTIICINKEEKQDKKQIQTGVKDNVLSDESGEDTTAIVTWRTCKIL